tara:strand:- start:12352 stop:12927 length:576 start_codon:yes stop_codon:yes gene_type:complete
MKKVIALACDGEFTNWDKLGGDLITWAFVEILEDLTLGRKMNWEIQGTSLKYWSKEAEEVHGISYWQASSFPERRSQLISIMNWLLPIKDFFPIQLVYHGNGNLDPEWLRMTFFKEDIETSYQKAFAKESISTLKLARENLKQLPNHKLDTIADHYNIKLDHHEALSDAIACAEIYCNIMDGKETFTGRLF